MSSMTEQEAEDKLRKAIALREMGALDEGEFNEIKNECLVVLGMRSNKSTPSLQPAPSVSLDPQPLISLLQKYDAERTGTWASQKKERLLGYLLDYRSPDINVQHLEQFVTVSYTYKLLSLLKESNQGFLQQTVSSLSGLYNIDFIQYCLTVWSQVLGIEVASISRPKSTATSSPPSQRSPLAKSPKSLRRNPPVVESQKKGATPQSAGSRKDKAWLAEQQRLREHSQRGLVKTFSFDGVTTVLMEEEVTQSGFLGMFGKTEVVQKEVKQRVRVSHEMIYIPSGWFVMGALPNDGAARDSEKPCHKVKISRNFWLGKYPVTQALYQSVMGSNPSRFKGENLPVEKVSWCDAVLFCNKLSEKEGLTSAYDFPSSFQNDSAWANQVKFRPKSNGYRLPTEAEWEYACRGGEEHRYSGSNTLDEVGWHSGNSGRKTHPVGQKKANGFGLYDMSGNIWEWIWDRNGKYEGSSKTDPVGGVTSSSRVDRGGSWNRNAIVARASNRNFNHPSRRSSYIGFRVLRVAE